jgi:HEAT repeat protein
LRKQEEAWLEELQQIRHGLRGGTRGENLQRLRRLLSLRSGFVVGKAAALIAAGDLSELEPELKAAFERCLSQPLRRDPGCMAKTAIVEALYRLGASAEELFLQALHCRQPEPVWGGLEDTAVALRGCAALALVRMNYVDALGEIAELLADPEREARVAAARALAYTEDPHAVPLLRYKICAAESDPAVITAAMEALLQLDRERGMVLATRWLREDDPERAEAIALALGTLRSSDACQLLTEWAAERPRSRSTAFLALAMTRQEEGLVYLLDQLGAEELEIARDALEALSVLRHDARIVSRVAAALGQREDAALRIDSW